jgi:autoinducer 2 (AI-2) kinase
MAYIIAFDFGTGAAKCVLFDEKGGIAGGANRGVKYTDLSYAACSSGVKGGLVFDADAFWALFAKMSRELIAENGINPADIVAVAAASQRQGMVFVNDVRGEIYSAPCVDLRGEAALPALLPHACEIKAITGIEPHGMFGLARLLWFQKHQPALFKKIHRVMMLSDWLVYRLCGNIATEKSAAASSQLFDVKACKWSSDIMERFGFSAGA